MKKIDFMLLRMIQNSKSQFIAILVIIVTGIVVFTSMNMTSINMRNTVDDYYEENRFPHLFLQAEAFPAQQIERASLHPDVEQVMGRIHTDGRLLTEDPNQRVNLQILSTNSSDPLSWPTLLEGHLLQNPKEVLVVEQFANARNIGPQDPLRIQINGVVYSMEVAGIIANPEHIYLVESAQSLLPDNENFGVLYVEHLFAQRVTGLAGNYNELLVSYQPDTDEDFLVDRLKEQFRPFGVTQVVTRETHLSNAVIDLELENLQLMANSVPILFLLVAGLILMMMLGRMVKRDRMKIGILKAIGYSNRAVLMHYVKYALVAGLLGGALGSVLGMALAGAMTRLYLDFFHIPMLTMNFYYSYIFIAMLLSATICILSGLLGARGVMKIAPADAMGSEIPKGGKRIFLENWTHFWKQLSFSQKLAIKNLFRNKKRSLFVLAGVALTFGMMTFTNSMTSVMDDMMVKHFTEFQTMGYNISLKQPVEKHDLYDLPHIIKVEEDEMEGRLEAPFTLTNGHREASAVIIGLDPNSRFIHLKDPGSLPQKVPAEGILLSQNMAQVLDVKTGDWVEIQHYLPGRENEMVQVAGQVKQTLGMNGYMDLDYMGALLFEKGLVNGVYLDSDDPLIQQKLIKASNISSVMSSKDSQAVYQEYMTMTYLSIAFMVLFSGVLGFAIVYNATMVNLSSRELEFSSLRVMGFTRKEIFQLILKENNILLGVGILLGIPVGRWFSYYSSEAFTTDIYHLDLSPSLHAYVLATIYTILFILLAQLATYRKIQKLDFLKALKSRES